MKFKIAGCCIAMLLLLATSAFAQWQFAYKQVLGYDFNAVHFPTASVGYTVGNGGVIFKTTDGGTTWVQQTSPTAVTLNDVFFSDATHGFAVGASGTIIYTADGSTWLIHPQSGVVTTNVINAVWFVGSHGWLGGGVDGGTSTTGYADILISTDGGTTWAQNTGTDPSIDFCTDISFIDENNGYASLDGKGVPLIMYTTDGGQNWTGSTVGLGPYPYTRKDIECIYAVSGSIAVAGGWGSNVGNQPTIILVSTDGGANFNTPDATYPWATYTYGYNFAKFDDGEVMIVGGGSQSAGMSVHSTSPYTTWTRYPAFYGETLNDACALPGTSKVVAVGQAGCIAVSTDHGNTWTFSYDAGMPFQGLQAFAGSGKDKVWSWGAGGALLLFDLASGTHNYMMVSPNNWGPSTAGDIDYVANTKIPPSGTWDDAYNDVMYVCGGTSYLCKSINFGKTWQELAHTNSLFDGKMSMHWFDQDTGIVVGYKDIGNRRGETIWRTTDGGQTLTEVWSYQVNPATSEEWNSVAFAPENPSVGVAVGDDNFIVYTTDRGYHWALATENIATATLDIEEVVMINSLVGYAVGDSGTLIKTTNGGQNWVVQAVPWGTANLLGIEFSTPNRLWVCGAGQVAYYSTNGGTSWTQINVTQIVASHAVNSIYYQGPAGILWVGCTYSDVLNRSDQPVTGTDTPALPFALNQNYPNPFNPSTTIVFSIAKDGHVSLNVYDVTGRLVATVMNKNLKAGNHTVSFNADKLATGVYFYKLTTSTGEMTRKMVLVR